MRKAVFDMAQIKCPECRMEISEDKESCPICGFKIKEFNEKSEREYNKTVKFALYKKVGFVIILVIVTIVAIITISANQKLISFQNEVNEFNENWDNLIKTTKENPSNLVSEDLLYKALVASMDELAEMYVRFDDKSKIEEYLEEHTWKEQYERVMKYNEEHENREINQEFVEFYTHMK